MIDLEARRVAFETTALDLGDAGIADNLVVGANGRAFAIHGTTAYEVGGKVPVTHTHATGVTACLLVDGRLGCVVDAKWLLDP